MRAAAHLRRSLVGAALALTANACVGSSQAELEPSDGVNARDDANPPLPWEAPGLRLFAEAAQCASSTSAALMPLRRLSRIEYNNAVRDLLGDRSRPADGFVAEQKVVGFNSNRYAPASVVIARQYLTTAESVARAAVGERSETLFPCAEDPGESCVASALERLANRAFRGELTQQRLSRLLSLYQDTRRAFDESAGREAALVAILTAPQFLFVFEPSAGRDEQGAPLLSPNALAARLAFFLWRSLPDDELLEAARSGGLGSREQIRAQALRLLQDPRSEDALQDFANQWLEVEGLDALNKDASFAAVWSPQVARALHQETLLTFSKTVVVENGTLAQLFTSPTSYINGDLAEYYGVSVSNLIFGRRSPNPAADPAYRIGVLTQGGVLAAHAHGAFASPVLRGRLIRDRILCSPVPPPGPGVSQQVPDRSDAADTSSIRARLAAHASDASCRACHDALDPPGFAFGAFDATGRLLPPDGAGGFLEGAQRVDTSGSLSLPGTDLDGLAFDSAGDLISKLVASPVLRSCFALQQFRYALSRAEAQEDACSLQEIDRAFADSGLNLKELLLAIVSSASFRRARATQAGGCRP